MQRISGKAGLSMRYTCHCVRVSTITILYRSGIDTPSIRSISKSKSTTGLLPYLSDLGNSEKRECSSALTKAFAQQPVGSPVANTSKDTEGWDLHSDIMDVCERDMQSDQYAQGVSVIQASPGGTVTLPVPADDKEALYQVALQPTIQPQKPATMHNGLAMSISTPWEMTPLTCLVLVQRSTTVLSRSIWNQTFLCKYRPTTWRILAMFCVLIVTCAQLLVNKLSAVWTFCYVFSMYVSGNNNNSVILFGRQCWNIVPPAMPRAAGTANSALASLGRYWPCRPPEALQSGRYSSVAPSKMTLLYKWCNELSTTSAAATYARSFSARAISAVIREPSQYKDVVLPVTGSTC